MAAECLTGRVVLPGDPSYDPDRQDWNKRFDVSPRAIVYCQRTADVVNAVRCATEQGVPLSVRSGGHSYEGFSLCDGFVVDVSGLDAVDLSPDGARVDAGPGVGLLAFYTRLAAAGRVVPGGTCRTVGLAGLALGGGFGLLSRALGLTCDNLVEVELVTADGNVVVANRSSNPELLWACQGGGGSFGVATRLRFRTAPIGDVTSFTLAWQPPGPTTAHDVLATWQEAAPSFPDEVTCLLRIQRDRVMCQGVFLGWRSDLPGVLGPLLRVGGWTLEAAETSWLAAATAFADETMDPYWKASSAYADRSIPPRGIETVVAAMRESPPGAWVQFDNYGGAVNRVAPGATAFPHRAMRFSTQYIAQWPTNDPETAARNTAWLEGFARTMRDDGYLTPFAYANYCDLDLPDYLDAYYAGNAARLRDVKTAWDPADVFSFAQSIPPWGR